ncbi:3'-5' exonuclease [uncultured Umboniibacter sp.]|uniref:3'-5' exonuclease n=1 Tax=uncultured Umboniibacter sp. TaxID=1798917 RepID=UPI002603B2C9|nr:3'-5' exonuclease [uncultured Umboniibacter sp.]
MLNSTVISTQFPMDRIEDIKADPSQFRLLEKVALGGQLPVALADPVGDERAMCLLDFETTGLSSQTDRIIELGMIKVDYSPSANRVTRVLDSVSMYEDPGIPIPEVITQITGICDEDVKGKAIDESVVEAWMKECGLVVAHNAGFDRGFFDKRFPHLNSLPWACSLKDVDWRELGFEGNKLEYLLLKLGYFYDGHRAEVDCFAMAWLFHLVPESLAMLRINAGRVERVIKAVRAPFEVKDSLKGQGYRWNGDKKYWHKSVDESELEEELLRLGGLYDLTRFPPDVTETVTAKNRYS